MRTSFRCFRICRVFDFSHQNQTGRSTALLLLRWSAFGGKSRWTSLGCHYNEASNPSKPCRGSIFLQQRPQDIPWCSPFVLPIFLCTEVEFVAYFMNPFSFVLRLRNFMCGWFPTTHLSSCFLMPIWEGLAANKGLLWLEGCCLELQVSQIWSLQGWFHGKIALTGKWLKSKSGCILSFNMSQVFWFVYLERSGRIQALPFYYTNPLLMELQPHIFWHILKHGGFDLKSCRFPVGFPTFREASDDFLMEMLEMPLAQEQYSLLINYAALVVEAPYASDRMVMGTFGSNLWNALDTWFLPLW